MSEFASRAEAMEAANAMRLKASRLAEQCGRPTSDGGLSWSDDDARRIGAINAEAKRLRKVAMSMPEGA